mmetsp:Transcript_44126/g.134379  ORF Transcript_44126/g.134379 Transcript_44126/m.134379 type:complete len:246 (-) Transcript_44126:381-1118(-)
MEQRGGVYHLGYFREASLGGGEVGTLPRQRCGHGGAAVRGGSAREGHGAGQQQHHHGTDLLPSPRRPVLKEIRRRPGQYGVLASDEIAPYSLREGVHVVPAEGEGIGPVVHGADARGRGRLAARREMERGAGQVPLVERIVEHGEARLGYGLVYRPPRRRGVLRASAGALLRRRRAVHLSIPRPVDGGRGGVAVVGPHGRVGTGGLLQHGRFHGLADRVGDVVGEGRRRRLPSSMRRRGCRRSRR